MPANMEIWNKVAKTDPKHTKAVSFGRKFTSIDAHYQIMRATETFGPVGLGWRYDVDYSTFETGGIVFSFADVMMWWMDGETKAYYGPVRGCSCLVDQKARVDTDAPKKALTDALTKALSHLGFSADVFLGLFDDNKYIQQITKEFEQIDKAVVDMKKVESVAVLCRELVDKDDEDTGPLKAKELYQPLSNDERIALQAMMKESKPEGTGKTYWSCFHDHLKIQVEREKNA